MKKLIIAIVLVAVVVGGTFGGLAAANGGPTLKAIGFSSPGDITVVGTAWVPGLPVDLFMDVQDVNHHVGVATPDAKGGFTLKFGLLGTVIGNHVVIGVQGFGPPVNAPFTLKGSSPVDDRTYQEVANIEAKLDDPNHGLVEIKAEVAAIEDAVNTRVPAAYTDADGRRKTSSGTWTYDFGPYPEVRLINLTLRTDEASAILFPDKVRVYGRFLNEDGSYAWDQLDGWSGNDVETLQFVTDAWRIQMVVNNAPMTVNWNCFETARGGVVDLGAPGDSAPVESFDPAIEGTG